MDGTITGTRQFVIFKIGTNEYGIDIQNVTAIEKINSITRVPKTPDYVKGVINLRGEIIPVIDFAKKLGLQESEYTDDTRVLIATIDEITVGIKVDAVSEVVQLAEDSIESITNIGIDALMEYVVGVGKLSDRIITLVSLEKLLSQ